MVIIKPEWVGFELRFSHSYPDDSKWGMTYESCEVDHVDTGHSDKIVKIDCDVINVELDTLRKESKGYHAKLDEIYAYQEFMKITHGIDPLCKADVVALKAERDRYRDAWAKANEHFSDAWGLSVGYDGFEKPDSLKGLIDDIILNMNLGRKVMNEALEASDDIRD